MTPSLTLLGIDGAGNRPLITKAMQHSMKGMRYERRILLSPHSNYQNTNGIDIVQIDPMSYEKWNEFVIKSVHKYIETSHYLFVDTDGFVINPHLWTDEFLDYDYIGAPFYLHPHILNSSLIDDHVKKKNHQDINLVGNGGFTLRSKKLTLETPNCPDTRYTPEDVYISVNNFDYFTQKGLKFCPKELADRFSQNEMHSLTNTFGFHGDKGYINHV